MLPKLIIAALAVASGIAIAVGFTRFVRSSDRDLDRSGRRGLALAASGAVVTVVLVLAAVIAG